MNRRRLLLGIAALSIPAPAAAATPFSAAERQQLAEVIGGHVLALDDAALTSAILSFAIRESGLRLRPPQIDPLWTLAPEPRDLDAELRSARAGSDLTGWLRRIGPGATPYRQLVELQARYAQIAASGGWASMPDGATLRPGARDTALVSLRTRLAAEGYATVESADPSVFDGELEAALRTFQANHGLEPDGVLGPATRQVLSTTAAERVAQIEANLERLRWRPRQVPANRIEVDTGLQEAALFTATGEDLRMRVIVGASAHPTPMFAAQVDAVVLNPVWNVPESIARNELLPAEARRPGYLAGMGIRWVDGRLQQRAGPQNALGLVKLEVKSPFGVHLHDTPGKALFRRPIRAFSHGCVRLENPQALAMALLAPLGFNAGDMQATLASGETRRIPLRTPMPLLVTHTTATVAPEGRGLFRPDVYGWDRKLGAALRDAGRSLGA